MTLTTHISGVTSQG